MIINGIIRRTDCCGLRLVYGIANRDPLDVIHTLTHAVAEEVEMKDSAHYAFTDNTGEENEYGGTLAQNLTDFGLGTVVATPFAVNPNSGNMLKAFLFTPDRAACQEYYQRVNNDEPQRVLEEMGFTIGTAVRSQGLFPGRAKITGTHNGLIRVTLKNDNSNVRLTVEQARSLIITRPY